MAGEYWKRLSANCLTLERSGLGFAGTRLQFIKLLCRPTIHDRVGSFYDFYLDKVIWFLR